MTVRLQPEPDVGGRLVCPTCRNDHLDEILLFAETTETDRYSYDRTEDGGPVFAHGKSVHTDRGSVPPSAGQRKPKMGGNAMTTTAAQMA